ncbi:MAG: PEP-utilizing enzyme [Candidatus Poribacteria bacterium]|nr:PEP-utilizing enzyme [Candidatus Poribacteria bacterium]
MTEMSRWIVPLDSLEVGAADIGVKAANLGSLIRAGFPVPTGFCVTTDAYDAFMRQAWLAVDAHSSPDLETVRALFAKPLPFEVASAITDAFARLGEHVAVRSSATSEDLPEASFAGQLDSFLNISDNDALLDAVKHCWASAWSERAVAYRERMGVADAAVHVGVIVQPMLDASAAGVLFTVNPLTGDEDEMIVNAAFGLGESVVAGRVVPDTVRLDKETLAVRRTDLSEKTVKTVTREGGVRDVPIAAEHRRDPSITPQQATELARIGRNIEQYFGSPQDIEWAIAGDDIHILQSRPVTVSASAPPDGDDWFADGIHPQTSYDLWTRGNLGEIWQNAVTPLTWSGISTTVNAGLAVIFEDSPEAAQATWAQRFYGHVYFNEGMLRRLFETEYGLVGSWVEAGFGDALGQRGGDQRIKWGTLLRRFPKLLSTQRKRRQLAVEFEATFPQIDRWVAEFNARDLSALSDQALWREARDVWKPRALDTAVTHMVMSSEAVGAYAILDLLTRRWLKRDDLAHELIAGLDGVLVAEIGERLRRMARAIRAAKLEHLILYRQPADAVETLRQTRSAESFLQQFDEFLERHGHRCPNEGEWLHPRWRDAPEQVLILVGQYLRDDAHPVDPDTSRQRRDAAESLAMSRLGGFRRAVFRRVLDHARQSARLRDNGRHVAIKVGYPTRPICMELAQRWADRRWIDLPDDFHFLVVTEIDRIIESGSPDAARIDTRPLIEARRKAYEHWLNITPPPVVDKDGEPVSQRESPISGNVLTGIAASGGKVVGTARVLRHPSDGKRLGRGDIAVVRATDSGWTPLFPLIGGLVTELGGQLSHAVIVAREYGIPAVVGVSGATTRIRDGQRIEVDGSNGCVALDPPA